MRILMGPCDKPVEDDDVKRIVPDWKHELLFFGSGDAQLRWHGGDNSYAQLQSQFPAGWKPDLVIFNSPEYEAVPAGIEEADCLTAAIVGDWNLGGQAVQLTASAFDILIADRNGCELLRKAGHSRVVYAPFFSFDPRVHYRMENVERDLDVVMIGSFHADVQRERARWVARVAGLSRRHRVHLTCNVYGEEYTRLMNRAKIVFNRSIRGEINMRAYEAPACGALMFYERENEEIRGIYRDREECVLYGDDDLEELIEYYLAHDDERRAIAEAGWRAVQTHAGPHKTVDILARLKREIEAGPAWAGAGERGFSRLPEEERRFRRAYQWLLLPDRKAVARAETELSDPEVRASTRVDLINARACALAQWALTAPANAIGPDLWRQALGEIQRCLALDPSYAAARLNYAFMLLTSGDVESGRAQLETTEALLRSDSLEPRQLMGPYLPRMFSGSDVEIEWQWMHHEPLSGAWKTEMRRILLWRAVEKLGEIAFSEADFALGVHYAAEEASLAPARGSAQYHHARALRALGRSDEAVEAYHRAIGCAALAMDIRIELAHLLCNIGRTDECLAVLDETVAIIEGAPCFERHRKAVQIARRQCLESRAKTPETDSLRLLALPDWNDPASWQPLIRAYARVFCSDEPVSLRLRVDPETHPREEVLIPEILRFVETTLGLPQDELPDVTLMNEPLAPTDRWKLFLQADVLVSGPESADNDYARVYAEARGLLVVPVEKIGSVRALAPQKISPIR